VLIHRKPQQAKEGIMPFVAFPKLCLETAERETRTIILRGASAGLPAGSYEFLEMFCDESGCDCRRVMFSVFCSTTTAMEAVIAWGWESLEFYERWLGLDDPDLAREMKGPILNLASPQSRKAPAILKLAANLLLTDAAYVARLKRHYAMFREKIDRAARSKSWRNRQPAMPLQAFGATAERQNLQRSSATVDLAGRVGRNHPCPCGSGKKFKLCCMK